MAPDFQAILGKAEDYARAEIEKYGSPFLAHFEASNQKGLELAQHFGVDSFVVQLGTRLMDLKLGEALSQGRLGDHVAMSSQAAKEFLAPFGLEASTVAKVVNCIEAHHHQAPWECKEAEIVANADCYRFLVIRNWLGYFMLLGTRSTDVVGTLEQAERKLEEKWGILSLDICRAELEPQYKLLKQVIAAARQAN